jgi:hypothetical protein
MIGFYNVKEHRYIQDDVDLLFSIYKVQSIHETSDKLLVIKCEKKHLDLKQPLETLNREKLTILDDEGQFKRGIPRFRLVNYIEVKSEERIEMLFAPILE